MSNASETPAPMDARFAAEGAFAQFLLRRRRRREEMLGKEHFADPVWDMMLDLFAARTRGEEVAVSSLIIAAGVPQSTALRHMRVLVQKAMLVTRDDPRDGRRTFIGLSDDLFERVGQFLRQSMAAGHEFWAED
ncbi:MAG: hypothetical protein EOP89_14545 [Lysobacteraceae bacterium]|nr:MAG: hypothetical protein EOP89_14545 [Xanthomonadaceae bacterium]